MHLIRLVSIGVIVSAILCGILAPAWAQNLLINPGFEIGPYGQRYEITGWIHTAAEEKSLFEGIFDASWNNPPLVPSWPSNFGPRSGDHYLGRYYKTEPYEPSGRGLRGWVAQQVTGRAAGEKLYGSLWVASHLPNGGGVRIGLDPSYEPDPEAAPPPGPTMDTVWIPADLNGINQYESSEAAYKKMNVSANVGFSGTMTIWVEYITVPNNIADIQIVQIDDVRLGANKSMEIRNIEVYSTTASVATVVWDTYDADTPLASHGEVDYGLTNAYGGIKIDSTTRFNHTVNLTGLVLGNTYHYRIRNTADSYEGSATVDLTFKHVVAPVISNVADDATADTATVTWTTDINSDSTVSYGYRPNEYLFTASNPTLTKNHTVTLTNLLPNTAYYYRVTSCSQPPDGCRSTKLDAANMPLVFVTDAGPFWNGDFEFKFGPTHTEFEDIPGWERVTGEEGWFPDNKWEIDAQSGGNYVGVVSQASRKNGCIYQRFGTTPGEVLAFAGWLWAEGVALEGSGGAPLMMPHRYGEQFSQIGIDPAGGVDPNSPSIVWSSRRQTQSWREFMQGDPWVIHEQGTQWEKVAVTTYAQTDAATLFLRAEQVFPAGWNFHAFDNIAPEPFAAVGSVAQAKALPNDSLIDLAPTAAADCPVVTYIADPNYDEADNDYLPYFYIQDSAQPAAIKVTMIGGQELPAWLEVGKKVRVKGSITWGTLRNRYGAQLDLQLRLDKPAGERAIRALQITDAGATGAIEPIAMTNKSLNTSGTEDVYFTNAGAAGAPGTHNTGIVVRVTGKVIGSGETLEGVRYIVIDDGSVVTGFSGYPTQMDQKGLAVYTGVFDYSSLQGQQVTVTGIAGVKVDNDFDDPSYTFPGVSEAGMNIRWIKPLPDENELPDIQPLN